MDEKKIVEEILKEVKRAETIHPGWPNDIIHGAAIVCEESGELIRHVVNHVYVKPQKEQIRKEAIHTAATAIRLLKNLDL